VKRHLPFIIIAAAFLAVLGSGTALYFWKKHDRALVSVRAPAGKPGAEPAHIRGSPSAGVKIEEFGDFQCPSCAALSPALSQSEQKYHGKTCVVFRHFPLANHRHAQAAARAAEAAGLQDRFWEMHDLLYGSQLIWTRATDTRELFEQFAKSIGLDVERFKIDVEGEQVKARIIADQQRAASLGVDRTPVLFIDNRRVAETSLNPPGLHAAIDAALSQKGR
jgi:protein-disulfide isomerase